MVILWLPMVILLGVYLRRIMACRKLILEVEIPKVPVSLTLPLSVLQKESPERERENVPLTETK